MRIQPYARFLWILAIAALAAAVLQVGADETLRNRARAALFPSADLYRRVEQFRDVLEIVSKNYVDADAATLEKLTHSALRGMLSELDPHTDFLPARQYAELQADTRQEYGGIGIQVELRAGRMTIIAPMAGSPAELSGLARGDQILSVDGKSIEGLGLNEMVERLRGKPGTRVTLTVVRPSTGQTLEHSLERRLIETRSVDGVRFVSEGIGYISLTNFYEKTAEEFLAAVERLETGGMQALIIDLRNNPGGLLTAAVDVAGVFFRQGETIVYTQGRDERSRQYLRSRNRGKARGLPVAVLINSGSASASEIVAGALQDARRAVIIGETSFGKGLVQSIVPLRGGDALRLTTAQYFTPSGRRIQEAGVPPDIEISLPVEEENQVRLWRSRSDLLTPEQFREIYGQDPLADRQLETAIDALEAVLRSQTISG